MQVIINTDILCAVKLFSGKQDIRYYLNGVYLETGPNGGRLVATDGHAMAVARIHGSFPESAIIIPAELVNHIKSQRKMPNAITIEYDEGVLQHVDGNAQCREIKVTWCNTISGKEIDGRYPDYRRVVPHELSGELAQYNPELLMRVAKAQSLLGCKNWNGIGYNGNSAGYSNLNDDAFALVMPWRTDSHSVAGWAQDSLIKEERKAA